MSTYTVAKGDTLFAIAAKFGMTVAELKTLNGLKDNSLKIGQVLKLKKTPAPAPTPAPPKPVPVPPTPSITMTYKVVKGDTLSAIAKRFGTTVDAIKTLNKLKTTALSIGQVLQVPVQPKPVPPAPVPPPPVPTPTPPVVVPGDYLGARRQFGLAIRQDVGFQRFELSVPLLDGRTVVARMRDNVTYSTFTKYPQGIVYGGQSAIHVPVEKVESVGLSKTQAAALEYVSSHEGKYDAINSYDGGIFSYGSVQFVGAAEHGGSLNRVLAGMKTYAPAKFAQVFQQVGIDSAAGVTTVLDESGRLLSGDEAWLYIQKTVPLYGAFIRAGFDPDLVLEQLRAANDLYVQPALNFRLNLTINGVKITVPRLRDILSSEGLLTALIAIAINRGTGSMGRMVGEIMTTLATTHNLTTPEALRNLDERLFCQTIAETSTDTRTRDRALGVLNAGLSFEKA
ncbi:MAG: LysM peptidoglycan-binding domain-containing protein [Saprospiraceae bacterium]|jgi:LysM repeat protein|nr:LysM peptidoglycan-binding domain-containing protein [Saprospiraceae bacterium]